MIRKKYPHNESTLTAERVPESVVIERVRKPVGRGAERSKQFAKSKGKCSK